MTAVFIILTVIRKWQQTKGDKAKVESSEAKFSCSVKKEKELDCRG